MKVLVKSVISLAVFLAGFQSNALCAEHYVIDASHTSVIFGISHLGYSYTYGRFNNSKGNYVLNRANPAGSRFQLSISAASIDTNDKQRDEHLKSPDFFNAKQFPGISFQSTGVSSQQTTNGIVYQVNGKFTMHGISREITLPLKKLGEGKGPAGDYRTGFLCQTSLKRSDFGINGMIPMIGNDVAITISFEGIRQGPADASGAVGQPAGEGSGSADKQGRSGVKQ